MCVCRRGEATGKRAGEDWLGGTQSSSCWVDGSRRGALLARPWPPRPFRPGRALRGKAHAWRTPGARPRLPSRARPSSEFSLVTAALQSLRHCPDPDRRRAATRKAAPRVCLFVCALCVCNRCLLLVIGSLVK